MKEINSKNYDFIKSVYPYMYYRRLNLSRKEKVSFDIEYGFNYWARTLTVKSQSLYSNNTGVDCKVEFVKVVHSRVLQNEAYPPRLISTPAGRSSYSSSPAPVDNNAFSVSASAEAPKSLIRLNHVYHYSENIELDVSVRPESGESAYVDILIAGYKIPENIHSVWGS